MSASADFSGGDKPLIIPEGATSRAIQALERIFIEPTWNKSIQFTPLHTGAVLAWCGMWAVDHVLLVISV